MACFGPRKGSPEQSLPKAYVGAAIVRKKVKSLCCCALALGIQFSYLESVNSRLSFLQQKKRLSSYPPPPPVRPRHCRDASAYVLRLRPGMI